MQMQDHVYRSDDVVRFLRLWLRKIDGKLLVIWDGAPIHRGKEIKAFLARGAAKLHLEQLPGYAPELNPDEGIWNLREAGSNSKIFVAATWLTWRGSCDEPKNGCDTTERSFAVASESVDMGWIL
jgi:transposase